MPHPYLPALRIAPAVARPRRTILPIAIALAMSAAPAFAGHGHHSSSSSGNTRNLMRGGPFVSVAALAGWTYDRTSTTPPVPEAEMAGIVTGLNTSLYYSWRGMAIPGVGAGVYLDDGAFSIDLVPKIATLYGVIGAGAGGTLRDGEPGFVAEGWIAVFGGLRLRATRVENCSRTSASLFFAMPLQL